jgi:hypothetical protein
MAHQVGRVRGLCVELMGKCRATSRAAREDLAPTMQEQGKDSFADACSEFILPPSLTCGHVNEGGSRVDGCVRFAERRLVGVEKSSDARILMNDQFLSLRNRLHILNDKHQQCLEHVVVMILSPYRMK